MTPFYLKHDCPNCGGYRSRVRSCGVHTTGERSRDDDDRRRTNC